MLTYIEVESNVDSEITKNFISNSRLIGNILLCVSITLTLSLKDIVVDFGFWEEFNMSRYVFFEFFDDIILLFGI